MIRRAIFWGHLVVGTVVGLFILNMAASGISIAYSKQITALAERDQRVVAVPANAAPLDLEKLIAKVQAARPQAHLSGVTIYADPAAAAMFMVGREGGVIYANPYTGDVTGDGAPGVRGFFQFMTGWHRWLALEGTARPIGQAITGVIAISYLGLLISGLFLWLPRPWSRARVKTSALIDTKLRGKARDWNWHNVAGIWCAPLLLLVTLTATIMSYNWAGDLLFRLTGNPVPEHRQGGRGRDGGGAIDVDGINPLWLQAQKKVPDWKSINLRFSASEDAPASFQIDTGDGTRPDTIATLALDRDDGSVVRWQPYEIGNAGQKLRSWVRAIHTGEAGGIIGQTFAVLAALGGITLVWTGLSMAFHRFFRQRKPTPELIPEPNPTSLVS